MFVHAISLWQPWASLVAWRLKEWETRGWPLHYEGPLAIHATAKEPPAVAELVGLNCPEVGAVEIGEALASKGVEFAELPRGCVVALAWAGRLLPTEEAAAELSPREQAFGDYSAGRWAKQLRGVVELAGPVAAKGGQRLWAWRPDATSTPLVQKLIGEITAAEGPHG